MELLLCLVFSAGAILATAVFILAEEVRAIRRESDRRKESDRLRAMIRLGGIVKPQNKDLN